MFVMKNVLYCNLLNTIMILYTDDLAAGDEEESNERSYVWLCRS